MAAFDEYRDNFLTDYFYRYLPGYLLNEGTTLYNEMKMYWDFMNNTRETWIERVMKPINIPALLNSYLAWIAADPTRSANYILLNYDHGQDKQFSEYELIIKMCSLYGIERVHKVGALSLAHMLRLLIFKSRMRLFDGSKRRLLEVYKDINLGQDMTFLIQTQTGEITGADAGEPATCKYYLLKSAGLVVPNIYFSNTDQALFDGGYYNIEILGIVYEYLIQSTDTLIYDNTNMKYDDIYTYDGI